VRHMTFPNLEVCIPDWTQRHDQEEEDATRSMEPPSLLPHVDELVMEYLLFRGFTKVRLRRSPPRGSLKPLCQSIY
jgi:hypothetical protein